MRGARLSLQSVLAELLLLLLGIATTWHRTGRSEPQLIWTSNRVGEETRDASCRFPSEGRGVAGGEVSFGGVGRWNALTRIVACAWARFLRRQGVC